MCLTVIIDIRNRFRAKNKTRFTVKQYCLKLEKPGSFFVKLCDTEFKGVSNKYLGADSESQTDGEAGRYDSHALNKGRPTQNTVHADCSIVANLGHIFPPYFVGYLG